MLLTGASFWDPSTHGCTFLEPAERVALTKALQEDVILQVTAGVEKKKKGEIVILEAARDQRLAELDASPQPVEETEARVPPAAAFAAPLLDSSDDGM